MSMLEPRDLELIGGVMDAKLVALEERFEKKLDVKLDVKLKAQKDEVVTEVVGRVVPEVVDKVVTAVGEMIEQNVLPQIDEVRADVSEIRGDVKEIKRRVTAIEATMVTKDDLDEKLGKVRGEFNLARRGLAA